MDTIADDIRHALARRQHYADAESVALNHWGYIAHPWAQKFIDNEMSRFEWEYAISHATYTADQFRDDCTQIMRALDKRDRLRRILGQSFVG